MPVAGFCSQCGENAYLDANWSCPRGHGWNAVSGWYDTATGQPVTPPWLSAQTAAAAPAAPVAAATSASMAPASVAPAPAAPAPTPVAPAPPPDPAVQLRRLIRDRMEDLGLKVAEKKGVYSGSRGKDYECAVAVDGTNGRVLLWERLREGHDPGVRDAVRTLAGGNWTVKIVLRREGVTG